MSADLLAALGEPADCVVWIDFETTYSKEYQLRKLTTESYIRDPRFQVIGVSVAVADRAPVWMEEHEFRAWAAKVDWSRVALGAHHSHFDGAICAWHYGIKPGFWICTLSMARAKHGTEVGNSLKTLALHYGVGEKGTEVLNALGKRREDFTPEEWRRYGIYGCNDTALARSLFWRLAEGFPETELWLVDTTVRMFTEPTIHLDVPLLEKSLETEKARKAALLERIKADREVLMSNDKFAALLIEMGVEPPTKVSVAKTKTARAKDPEAEEVLTYAFAKSDPGMRDLLEHENEEIRWLAEARVGVKSTITLTRTQRLLDIASRGPCPVYLKYAGAHTLRWSGADKVNLQNLNRGSDLRAAIVALAGLTWNVVDSTAIEARVLAWLAEHAELVAAFAADRDVYSEFATKIYGYPVNRKLKLPDGTKPFETQGHVGKTSILGLGYGMGWAKAAQTFLAGPMGAKPIIFGQKDAATMKVDVGEFADDDWKMGQVLKMPTRLKRAEMLTHCAVTEYIVDLYREENPPIPAFWAKCEEALHAMLEGREMVFGPGGCLRTAKDSLYLPTGLPLRYPGLEFKERKRGIKRGDSGFSYLGKGGKKREKLYGALLVENLAQRFARDIIGEQMLWLRAAKRHVAMSTHDEIMTAVPEAVGEAAYEEMLAIMQRAPNWAPGLPLNAEGGFSTCYGDAK